jgi:serine protease Do
MKNLLSLKRLGYVLTGLLGGAAMSVLLVGADPASAAHTVATPKAHFEVPDVSRSFADVIEEVSPAVVNITVSKAAEPMPASVLERHWNGDGANPFDDFFQHFFDMRGIPQGQPRMQGQGSGFVIDAAGYIVTNNHVIDGADKIVVTVRGGHDLDAVLVGADPKTDLALLKVDTDEPLSAVRFGDSDDARVGDWVLAIGNPFGLGGTATAGIISARGRDIQSGPYDDYLQIDAPINRGNSGGPVFNADGDVIGVNTAIYSPNGGSVGIGFAIPAQQAAAVVDQLKSSGKVQRGWLGVQIQDVDENLAKGLGLDKPAGALVADVVTGSPADDADIQVGDVITKFGGRDIDTAKSLSQAVADAESNSKIRVKVWRDGDEKTVGVELGESDETPQVLQLGQAQSMSEEKLGLSLAELNDDYRRQLGVADDFQGVVITRVDPNSSAAEQGLRAGDVISRINSTEIDNVGDAATAINAARKRGERATLLVRRHNGQQFVSIALS